LQTSSGPVARLALLGAELGLGYLQAWYTPAASSDTEAGGCIGIDTDQDNAPGTNDVSIRLVTTSFTSGNFYVLATPGSFAGMTGSETNEALSAIASGSQLFGLGGADLLRGEVAADRFSGGADADSIFGLGGADQLWGGAGNDWLLGGNGHDALYADGPTLDDADAPEATNLLEGKAGNDWLFGGAGQDRLLGGDGDDFLYGADGADILEGGAGHDRLIDGDGGDSLVGGDGADTLEGGGGNYRLVLQDTTDRLDGGHGHDWLILSTGLFIDLGLDQNQAANGAWIAGFEAVDARTASAAMAVLGS